MNAIWLIEKQQLINEQRRTGSDERIRTQMLKSDLERRVKENTWKDKLGDARSKRRTVVKLDWEQPLTTHSYLLAHYWPGRSFCQSFGFL